MTISITIQHNLRYLKANLPAETWAEIDRGDLDPLFELNMANANFSTFWSALGFTPDICGAIDGRTVLKALGMLNPALAERRAGALRMEGPLADIGIKVYDCGLRPDQINRYVVGLCLIAEEAARREEPVVWS